MSDNDSPDYDDEDFSDDDSDFGDQPSDYDSDDYNLDFDSPSANPAQTPPPSSSLNDMPKSSNSTETDLSSLPAPTWSTPSATKYLLRELARLHAVQKNSTAADRGWTIDFAGLANLYQWKVTLSGFDKKLPLQQDLDKHKIKEGVVFEVQYGPEHPQTPPYIRVIRPRFLQFCQGGGGHVTAGGSICLEMLTTSGWNPTLCFETVMLTVRVALESVTPYPARLNPRWNTPYTGQEAMAAFVRVARDHGWNVPQQWHTLFAT
ncbi:ubiquitin-conjugating enzyme/RWD-like protein [Geranomyces variabilis]|nr:ubiquitin-conjugating enzyme/RWD-like protein [Geranomyces variabilis]KAJ3137757.1 hypothetical protein HDU90_001708 [Geranomyces variabilis]